MSDQSGVTIVRSQGPVTPPAPPAPVTATEAARLCVEMRLLLIVSVLASAYLGILGFHDIPEKNMSAFIAAGAVILTSFSAIVGYWFGSSSSSKAKDETISKLSQ